MLDINMLYPGVEDKIVCQCNRSLIVAFQKNNDLQLTPFGQLIPPPSLIMQILLNRLDTGIVLRDLDESMLLVRL